MASDSCRSLVGIFVDWLSRELRPDVGRKWFDGSAVGGGCFRGGARRQPRDQPFRRGCERHVGGVMGDTPHTRAAGNVPRRRGDDIAAAGANIDSGSERWVLHLLGDDVRYLNTIRSGKNHMLAAAAGQCPPGQRDLMLAFEHGPALVAAVARI